MLLEATTRDLRQYKTELSAQQKPASVNAALAALRRFFSWAAESAQSQHSCVELSRSLAGTTRLQNRTCHFRGIRLLSHAVLGMKTCSRKCKVGPSSLARAGVRTRRCAALTREVV